MPSDLTHTLFQAKRAKGLTFQTLADEVGCDPVFLAAVFHGQASTTPEQAQKLVDTLDLDASLATELTRYPLKGGNTPTIPADPFLYRFHEILEVYGAALKDVVQESFGDGIMSAVDFTLHVEREHDPKGDRVKITMNGKFLPYRRW